MILLDTSALYALLDAGDSQHRKAKLIHNRLKRASQSFLIHNYLLLESLALVQRRLGPAQAQRLMETSKDLEMEWIGPELHHQAEEEWLSRSNKGLSFVDCTSFVLMRKRSIKTAFAFDQDFLEAGFDLAA